MLLVISEAHNPALSKVVGLIYADEGSRKPGATQWVIPGSCAPSLPDLELAASSLSTTLPAPEDPDATAGALMGEDTRYLDSEMAALVLGPEEVSRAIAERIPHGHALLSAVECVREYLREQRERILVGEQPDIRVRV